MSGIYIPFHIHSDYSLLDSCTRYQDYIDLVVRDGARAISISEHGRPLNWVEKYTSCKKAGIRYIHSVEIYLTKSLTEKVRDNYHTVLMARNMEGVKELNRLVSLSNNADHFYYNNRLSFDEFLSVSDNIISTSACLASPLNKLSEDDPYYLRLANKYTFLEIQPHIHPDQVSFNQRLVKLSKQIGKPLIAGTDTHSSSAYKAECRSILLLAKHKSYGDEDAFDLSYKTYDELVELFQKQGALTEDEYMTALDNTNLLYDMTEDIELDTSIKYPILYGSREEDDRRFCELVETKFADKLEKGIIPRSQESAFREAINEELRVLRKLEMTGFMLSMAEIISWCRDSGMAVGTARGSVGGSRVAYITDIIDMNPETWGTLFSRFANESRIEPGDIDTDVVDTDRPAIFQHIIDKFGEKYTARVASFGTLKEKATIDEIGRALADRWKKEHPNTEKNNPWSLQVIADIKSTLSPVIDEAMKVCKTEAERKKMIAASDVYHSLSKKYEQLFYYYDGMLETKISQSVHPAGMVISPVVLADEYGVFDKDGERCLTLDMDNAHLAGLIKYDMLILKSVKVIRDTCRYIGIPYPKTYEIDFDDQQVWDAIGKDQSMIFQFESSFAAQSLKTFRPRSIFDMSLVTACIRPSGASYRNELLQRKTHKNPTPEIDKLLEKNYGYLVYQEDVSKFLMEMCGLSGSKADTVRRGIAKKKMEILESMMPEIIEGYCARSEKPRSEAEREVKEYLKIIEDASAYMFNYSHSVSYCLLGYYYGYFKYYYPLEFITAYLNNAANDEDIATGTNFANRIGIKVTLPKWGISRSTFFFDKEKNIIAKGLSSVKYIGEKVGEELFSLSQSRKYENFTDVLMDISSKTSLDTRQLDILIKIDFFSEFGNQRELFRIAEIYYNTFKEGEAKQIAKEKVDDTPLGAIISTYSVGTTKAGKPSKSYIITDMVSILHETERLVLSLGLNDLNDLFKIRNFTDVMGYAGYVSGKEEDRPKLLVKKVFPARRKKDNAQFGYNIYTQSIGSGKESCFTIFNDLYNLEPVKEDDVILCKSYTQKGRYYTMTSYSHLY